MLLLYVFFLLHERSLKSYIFSNDVREEEKEKER